MHSVVLKIFSKEQIRKRVHKNSDVVQNMNMRNKIEFNVQNLFIPTMIKISDRKNVFFFADGVKDAVG